MKLSRCFIVAMLLFSMIVPAFSEGIDLSAMTDDELIELDSSLATELSSRGVDKTNLLLPGVYIAGKDIKPGTYILTSVNRDYNFRYGVYTDSSTYEILQEYKLTIPEFYMPCLKLYLNEYTRVNLTEGNVLYVDSGAAKVETQKPSWAP